MSMLNAVGNPWRVFDELLDDFPYEVFNNALRARAGRYPRVNVWESDKGLVMEAEIAGVDPAKIEISAEGNVLTIKGEKPQIGGSPVEFQRQFTLPFELNEAEVKATAKNGLLTLTIPRKAAAKRKIAIEAV